jgi:predicted P-loop ATPase/predicted transcriptional regulator
MDTANLSLYDDITKKSSNKTTPIDIFLHDIKEGKWQDCVLKIRTIKDYEVRKVEKKKIPYVTISGYFGKERKANELSKHTGLIGMDIDDISQELEGMRTLLSADPYVYSIFTSVSGTGLCVIFKIDGEKHKEAFEGIADYLIKNYQIIVDPSGKDVSRARFVSYDPDLYINSHAATFKKYLAKPKKRKIVSTIFVKNEFDNVVNEMVKNNVSCVEDYRDWLSIGFGLADQFGEGGREYFHSLSSCSQKYERSMCDKQYTHCLRSKGSTGKVTIATIYWFAKQAGINIYTEKTKRIAAVTSTQKKAGLNAQQIAENLEKFEGISKQDATDIIQQAFSANHSFSNSENIVDNIRAYLRHTYDLKRNVITRKLENNGKILDEIDLNTMYLDAKVLFDELNFELFMKVLFSNNTAQYNPLLEWFEQNTGHYTGVIDAFFGCFDTPDDIKYFGKKWLVGVISAIHGIHSPLMLILAGEKQGTGKTEAFRRMLPKELKAYYAESKLDAGKDDEILMTQKLIIMDDEMGGKSKKESKRLKELTSKQTFTLREPYGKMNVDLDRLAVLCGTTNDLQILNDPTGNRRQLPMLINGIDFNAYNLVDKRQLLIEAYNLYKSGFEWQLSREDVQKLAGKTEKFEDYSAEYELITKYFSIPQGTWNEEMSATDIKIDLEARTGQKLSLRKIGLELKRLGFYSEIKKINKSPKQVYFVQPLSNISNNQPNPF